MLSTLAAQETLLENSHKYPEPRAASQIKQLRSSGGKTPNPDLVSSPGSSRGPRPLGLYKHQVTWAPHLLWEGTRDGGYPKAEAAACTLDPGPSLLLTAAAETGAASNPPGP